MKRVTLLLLFSVAGLVLPAQIVPQIFNYQAVLRDVTGAIMPNAQLKIYAGIRTAMPNGPVVYKELHDAVTSQFGLFTLWIGSGEVISGDFKSIDWGGDYKYLEIEVEINGSGTWIPMGTTMLKPVPYALYSLHSGDTSQWVQKGDTLYYCKGNVGIGTAHPGARLEIAGQVKITGGSPGEGKVLASNTSGLGNWTEPDIDFLTDGKTDNSSVFLGAGAGSNDDEGNGNTAVGIDALRLNTSGFYNNAQGLRALYSNTTGCGNTAFGYESLYKNKTGSYHTAFGYQSLFSDTSGIKNTAIGFQALCSNRTGSNNCANGFKALYYNTTGYDNTAVGFASLYLNAGGYQNTAMGVNALNGNVSGASNTAFGWSALYSNYSAAANTAVGAGALYTNQTGEANCALGSGALYKNSSGNDNVALGHSAMFFNTSGYLNTAVGCSALGSNVDGYENTAAGLNALRNNSGGDRNTAYGVFAGYESESNAYCTFIGYDADNYSSYYSYTNSTALGNGATLGANSQVRIGNSAVTSIGGYAGWTNLSDARYKKNVTRNVPGLDFVMKLAPVNYQLDVEKLDDYLGVPDSVRNDIRLKKAAAEKSAMIQTGFLAQEVEEAARSLGFEFSGIDKPKNEHDLYGLRYAEFVVPLVKAVQEQQAVIEELKSRIEALEGKR